MVFRRLVMELSVLLLAGLAFLLAGLPRSFVAALPWRPAGPGFFVALLHLEQFAEQAEEQPGDDKVEMAVSTSRNF